jgi:hypothetical protein
MVVCCADVLGLIDVLDLVAYTTQGLQSGAQDRAGPLRWSSLEGKTAGDLLALFPRCSASPTPQSAPHSPQSGQDAGREDHHYRRHAGRAGRHHGQTRRYEPQAWWWYMSPNVWLAFLRAAQNIESW